LLEAHHRRQPALLLLFVTAKVDRACGQPGVHAIEGGDRGIAPRQLHADESVEQEAAPGGAIALIADTTDIESCNLRHDLESKLIATPIILDYRQDLAFHEGANPPSYGSLLRIENIGNLVEVTIHRRRRILTFPQRRCRARHSLLPSLSPWRDIGPSQLYFSDRLEAFFATFLRRRRPYRG